MTAYRMGKDLHQPHIGQRTDIENIQELKTFDIKRTSNPIKKWGIDLNRELSTDDSQMTEKLPRKCSTSLAIREMKSKQL